MKRTYFPAGYLVILLPGLFFSCASVNAINESPTRWGYGLTATPGWQLGEGPTSLHLVVGYSRIKFDGGGGHNRIWEFGSQIRYSFTKYPENGIWLGGGASYLNIASIADGSSGSDPHAGGFTIGPAVGYRFKIGRIPSSIYFSPSYLSRGKFEVSGNTVGASSSGYYAKFGLDLHLMSLVHAKGR
ncbi:MAG TPA: hypothetical protein VEV87_07040 [Chitinophagaceae bacterium]|nr:hypothetical protein [Chitinophagaceae bacterium]